MREERRTRRFGRYANTVKKTETDDSGYDIEREIPLMKGYTMF